MYAVHIHGGMAYSATTPRVPSSTRWLIEYTPGESSCGVQMPSGRRSDLLKSTAGGGAQSDDRQALTALSPLALAGVGPTITPRTTRNAKIPPTVHSAIFHHLSTRALPPIFTVALPP